MQATLEDVKIILADLLIENIMLRRTLQSLAVKAETKEIPGNAEASARS